MRIPHAQEIKKLLKSLLRKYKMKVIKNQILDLAFWDIGNIFGNLDFKKLGQYIQILGQYIKILGQYIQLVGQYIKYIKKETN